jgi:hypothetical protein
LEKEFRMRVVLTARPARVPPAGPHAGEIS